MELEPVYLRGDFGLEPTKRGFRLVAAQPLSTGPWRGQGMPFYSGAVSYRFRCPALPAGGRHVLRLGAWAGAVAAVEVNGREAGLIGWPRAETSRGGYELDVTAFLREKENRIRVVVHGTPKNLLGPFHCFGGLKFGAAWNLELPPRGTAWPAMWFVAPQDGPPPGDRYDLLDCGLLSEPELVSVAKVASPTETAEPLNR